MELPETRQREKQITSVGRDARESGALVAARCVEKAFGRSETARGRVEGNAHQIVFQFIVVRPVIVLAHRRQPGDIGGDIIEHTPVRRPIGERFELQGVAGDHLGAISSRIVEDDIGVRIDDLRLVDAFGVEELLRAIQGVGDQVLGGMPGRVHAGRQETVGLEVDLADTALVGDDRAAVFLPNMERHAFGVPVLEGVAVDALSGVPVVVQLVVENVFFPESRQVALGDAHRSGHAVGGLDQPVGQVAVHRIRRDEDADRRARHPFSSVFLKDFKADCAARVGFQQCFPGTDRNADRTAVRDQGLAVFAADDATVRICLVFNLKDQGRDVAGDGDFAVVGPDMGRHIGGLGILRYAVAAGGQDEKCRDKQDRESFHGRSIFSAARFQVCISGLFPGTYW